MASSTTGFLLLFLCFSSLLLLCISTSMAMQVMASHSDEELTDGSSSVDQLASTSKLFNQYGARQGSLRQSECPNACSYRCSRTSKRKACMYFCVKCCSTCLCVPPGTYGHKQVCPCYNDWKTQQGGPKCP